MVFFLDRGLVVQRVSFFWRAASSGGLRDDTGTHLLTATCGLVRRASQHTVQRNHGMDADRPEFRSAPSVNNVSTWISRPPHSAMERLARRRSGL